MFAASTHEEITVGEMTIRFLLEGEQSERVVDDRRAQPGRADVDHQERCHRFLRVRTKGRAFVPGTDARPTVLTAMARVRTPR